MSTKWDKIDIRVTVSDKQKIIENAQRFRMATGTYLRMLGLAGIAPFTSGSIRENGIATAAGVEFSPKSSQRAKAS